VISLESFAFGRESVVEQSPQRWRIQRVQRAQIGADHSSLNNAIESALALIPPDGGGRHPGFIRWQNGRGKDPAAAAGSRPAGAWWCGRSIIVLLARPQVGDVAIRSFSSRPESVLPGTGVCLF